VATRLEPSEELLRAMRFQWAIVQHVKSNAIVVGGASRMLGVGAGQMNRVQSVRLALEQAGVGAKGAVLASDAFFPFPDSVEAAAAAGVAAIVQPGGSKKDDEVVAAADRLGIAMCFTGTRHFRH
jgi:phosphoribosylaminoimidazolecarboxamide formyltransferase / IMP cyclohydrolase